MNNKTSKNLIALGALAFFLAGSSVAFAYVPGVWDPQPRVATNETGFTIVPMPKDTPVVVQTTSTPTPIIAQSAPIKTVTITPVKKSETTLYNNTNTNNPNGVNGMYNQNNSGYPYSSYNDNTYSNGSDITALSLNGSNSFMPDTIFEWILVILLILAIIVIIRRITRPADHEVHVVTGH